MIIAVWIVSGLVALVNLGAGGAKLVTPRAKLVEQGGQMAWTQDFSQLQIRGIAVLEVLAAIGIIVPPLTGILPILAGFAAAGVVLLQLGAIITHARRGEKFVMNIALLVLALFVALARFGVFGAL